MSFKTVTGIFICSGLLFLAACSDADKETKLVDLFTAASLDLIAISFSTDETQDIISIDTFFDYKIEGLNSNGVDRVTVNNHIVWSLSDGANSTINQSGRLETGAVAEMVTITAKVGNLSTTLDVNVSAAKFDQVIMLNSTPVIINMCQSQQIHPIGSYLNDDGSEEIRPVDNTIINSITWLIKNQEDNAPSQRAFINTVDSQPILQAVETGNVIIQAEALSKSSGNIITSASFNQTLDNNLNSLKLCLKSETNLTACSFNNTDMVKDTVVSLQAVGNYQATDGTSFNQNISANSKWGVDDNSVASIAFSTDHQHINITGISSNNSTEISVACGDVEQIISDDDIKNGVVLDTLVTCASGSLSCLSDSVTVNVVDVTVISLSVTANGTSLSDNSAFILATRPSEITFIISANFSDDSSDDVTTDTDTSYSNQSISIISGILNNPGEYTVLSSGEAEVEITFRDGAFTAKLTIP